MNTISDQQEIDIKTINPIMPSDLFKIIQDEIDNILKKICVDHQLDIDMVSKKYNMDVTKIGIKLGVKKRNRRVLPTHLQCMGRKLDGEQCSRSRLNNSDYCLTHQKRLPNGRIDDSNYIPKEKGKRGRKKKFSDIENSDEYIPTKLIV